MTRVALITGGQQGIGLGIATALHRAGWRIAVAADLAATDSRVKDMLGALPGSSYHLHDLRQEADDAGLVAAVAARHGPITTLVSNAGVPALRRGDILGIGKDSFDRCMAVNLRGAFFLAQAVARRMRDTACDSYRSLHFITSVSAETVSTDRAEYCISKAAASMMVKCFATALAPQGIGVFELRPGIIATDMTRQVREKYNRLIAEGLVPAGRWGQPEDVGNAILPLASGAMAYATGAVIPVGGGVAIHRM